MSATTVVSTNPTTGEKFDHFAVRTSAQVAAHRIRTGCCFVNAKALAVQ